jgi:hypothetical protein
MRRRYDLAYHGREGECSFCLLRSSWVPESRRCAYKSAHGCTNCMSTRRPAIKPICCSQTYVNGATGFLPRSCAVKSSQWFRTLRGADCLASATADSFQVRTRLKDSLLKDSLASSSSSIQTCCTLVSTRTIILLHGIRLHWIRLHGVRSRVPSERCRRKIMLIHRHGCRSGRHIVVAHS